MMQQADSEVPKPLEIETGAAKESNKKEEEQREIQKKTMNTTYLNWGLPIVSVVVFMMLPVMGTKLSTGVWKRGGTNEIIPGGDEGGPTIMDVHGVLAFLALILFPVQIVTGGRTKTLWTRCLHRTCGLFGIFIVPSLLLTGMIYAGQYWTNTSLAIIVNGLFAILLFLAAALEALRNAYWVQQHNKDFTLHKDLMFASIVLISSFAGVFRWLNRLFQSLTTCPTFGLSNLAFSIAILFGGVVCFVVWRRLQRLDKLHCCILWVFVVGGIVQWAGSIGLYGTGAFAMVETTCN